MIHRLREYWRTALSSVRYDGASIFLWRVIVKALAPVVTLDHQILFEIDLTRPIEPRQARVACRIDAATEADLESIADVPYPPVPAIDWAVLSDREEYEHLRYQRQRAFYRETFLANARRWLRSGEMCFVARIDDEIAHSNWIRFDWCTPIKRPIHLLPGEVYTTEAYTAEAWRGRALHEAVLSHMLRYAQSRGCTRAYTITDFTKAGSRRGVLRVGWTIRGYHLYVTPKWFDRMFIVQLGGNVEPILRYVVQEDGGT